MYLKILNKGLVGSNSYILGYNGEAVVIDVGNDADDIYEVVVNEGMRVKYIILTHGHYDHIAYVDELRRKTNAKVAIHKEEAKYLENPLLNLSSVFGNPKIFQEADIILEDGDVIEFGGNVLSVIHTPGHTPGGICVKLGNNLFTGDTLFDGDFGRTDLAGGDSSILKQSLEKLFRMDKDITIYPGHDSFNKLGDIALKCRTLE